MRLNNLIFILLISALNPAQAGNVVDDTLQSLQLDDASGVIEGLQRGMDVNFVNEDGYSLLMLAAKEGSPKVTAVLLNAGAKTYLSNAYGDNALLLATFGGQEAIVDMLLAKHASLEANARGWTPLHYAAYAGQLGIAKKFLARGANVNGVTDNGLSALMLASMKGHMDVVRALLMYKADTQMRDANNLSAADHALAANNTYIAELLQSSPSK